MLGKRPALISRACVNGWEKGAPAEMLGICQLWHFSEMRQSHPSWALTPETGLGSALCRGK